MSDNLSILTGSDIKINDPRFFEENFRSGRVIKASGQLILARKAIGK
jgi:hypothetical protein